MAKKTDNSLEFRLLRADEIDCRVATVKENGISLLLYKDARVDQNILDETVGPMNWQRRHCRENANCIVSIWDAEKGQWIDKEDTGTESYTEKEKGLASDSFKRACFNWGIGRELYTAPFIWIPAQQCKIEPYAGNGKPVYKCYESFEVKDIQYDGKNIVGLKIMNSRTHAIVYNLETVEPMVTQQQIQAVYTELKRTGVGLKGILNSYNVKAVDELTISQFKKIMDKLTAKPSKAPKCTPEESEKLSEDMDADENCGLPFK